MLEQNHSSTLCHLNDGHSKNNKYCEQHITLVKTVFACQHHHVNIMNTLLFDEETAMLNKIEKLKQSKRTAANIDLMKAAQNVCRADYKR